MKYMVTKKGCILKAHGENYILNPIEYPNVNINDILLAEYGLADRILKDNPDILEIDFEVEKIPGFPLKLTDTGTIEGNKKLIINRGGGLGDIIMFTPVLQYIRENIPGSIEITLSTFKNNFNLFSRTSLFNKIVPNPIRLSDFISYDYYLDIFREDEKNIFSILNMTDYYFHAIGVNPNKIDDRMKIPLLHRDAACNKNIENTIADLRKNGYRALVFLNLFTTSRLREMPLIFPEALLKNYPDVMFIIPDNGENDVRRKLAHIQSGNLYYLDTSHSLTEYMTAIYLSDLVVSSDSSAYHIAAAYNKPAIVLFGSIDPELRTRYYPTVSPLRADYKGEFCKSPCGLSTTKWINLDDKAGIEITRRKLYQPDKGCVEAVRRGAEYSPCMMEIPVERLLDLFNDKIREVYNNSISRKITMETTVTGIKAEEGIKKPQPTLTACMMVKNEEKFLPQCLESIKEYVDELIIVDTGSTDRTVEIAEQFGAKVYHHPWEDNFSKHRNQSISYATGEWILIIDADEELDGKSGPMIRDAIRQSSSSMIAIMVKSYTNRGSVTSGGTSVRLFKNGMGIEYDGIVHNQLKLVERPAYFPITLWHYGYDLDENRLREKRENSLRLLLKQAETRPEDYITLHHIAITYFAMHNYEEAYTGAKKTIDFFKKHDSNGSPGKLGWTYFVLCFSLYKMKRLEEAIELTLKSLQDVPKSVDLYHLLTCLSFEKSNYQDTLKYAEKYFSLKREYERAPESFGLILFEMIDKEADIYLVMGYAHYHLGNKRQSFGFFDLSRRHMKDNRDSKLMDITLFLMGKEEFQEALSYLGSINPGELVFKDEFLKIPRVYESQKRQDLVKSVYEIMENIFPDNKGILFQKGLYLLQQNNFENAAFSFEKARELDPGNADNLVNLGYALTRMGRTNEAKNIYLEALAVDPEHSNAGMNLGILYYRTNAHFDALPYLEKAIERDPEHIYAMLALSHILTGIGQFEKVVRLCEKILRRLDLQTDYQLDRLEDLGLLYFLIAKTLREERNYANYEIARKIGVFLSRGKFVTPQFDDLPGVQVH